MAEEKSRFDIEGHLNESWFYKKINGSDLLESKELLVPTVEIQGHGWEVWLWNEGQFPRTDIYLYVNEERGTPFDCTESVWNPLW